MFNTNKTKKTVSNNTTNQTPSVNIISEGTKLTGTLQSNSDIRVSGSVRGEAISKGKLIITDSGTVKGNITSNEADIAGKIEGDVLIHTKLILRQSAVIDGNIFTKTLIVEEGAKINGACKMGTDVKSLSSVSDAEYASETILKTAKAE